jgi:hypothetical protein
MRFYTHEETRHSQPPHAFSISRAIDILHIRHSSRQLHVSFTGWITRQKRISFNGIRRHEHRWFSPLFIIMASLKEGSLLFISLEVAEMNSRTGEYHNIALLLLGHICIVFQTRLLSF